MKKNSTKNNFLKRVVTIFSAFSRNCCCSCGMILKESEEYRMKASPFKNQGNQKSAQSIKTYYLRSKPRERYKNFSLKPIYLREAPATNSGEFNSEEVKKH